MAGVGTVNQARWELGRLLAEPDSADQSVFAAEQRLRAEEELDTFLVNCHRGEEQGALRYQGDVNEVVAGKPTGLTRAAYNGRDDLVALLITRKGARVDLVNGNGCLPLHQAVFNDQTTTARLLGATHGADPDQIDQVGEGRTALMSVNKCKTMVKVLLNELKASVNHPKHALSAEGDKIRGHEDMVRAWCKCGWGSGEEADLTRMPWRLARQDLRWADRIRPGPLPPSLVDSDSDSD